MPKGRQVEQVAHETEPEGRSEGERQVQGADQEVPTNERGQHRRKAKQHGGGQQSPILGMIAELGEQLAAVRVVDEVGDDRHRHAHFEKADNELFQQISLFVPVPSRGSLHPLCSRPSDNRTMADAGTLVCPSSQPDRKADEYHGIASPQSYSIAQAMWTGTLIAGRHRARSLAKKTDQLSDQQNASADINEVGSSQYLSVTLTIELRCCVRISGKFVFSCRGRRNFSLALDRGPPPYQNSCYD